MEAQEGALALAGLDVVGAKAVPFEVARRVGKSGESLEALVRSAHCAIVE